MILRGKTYHFDLKLISFLVFFILVAVSCSKDPIREKKTPVDPGDPPPSISYDNGIFVVNEGNYNWGNASITFISEKDSSIVQDVFYKVNNRSIGDVAQSMQVFNGKGYIVVNNSNRIEVVNLSNFKSLQSLHGFNSPRFIHFIDSNKAYVTNLLKDISVIDLQTLSVSKSIPVPYWTEGLITFKNLVFISCIGGYNEPNNKRLAKILVIDAKEDKIVDSIKTGKEPLGMVIDRKDKIWVLCTGGYDNYEAPSLIRIDPDLRIVEKAFIFPNVKDSPSKLCINSLGDTLYFLKGGIFQMPVNSASLPLNPIIPSEGHSFYGLAIHPVNGNVFVTDALDFIQNGWVYQYSQVTGEIIKSYKAGRIPGSFCFSSPSKRK